MSVLNKSNHIRNYKYILFKLIMVILNVTSVQTQGKLPARLVWSSIRKTSKKSGIYSAPVDPHKQRYARDYILASKVVSLQLPHYIVAFDSNDAKKEIAIMDIGRGNLAVVSKRNIKQNHRGITNKAQAVAVDWASGNVYWTDETHKWVFVSTPDFKYSSPIITDVTEPRGIAVYPQNGYLFWAETNSKTGRGRIMRSSLSGEDPEVILNVFGNPSSISLDYQNERIYWIDVGEMTVYYTDLSATNKNAVALYKNTSLNMKDLHVYKDSVYLTAENKDLILRINKTTGRTLQNILTKSPYGVAVIGGNMQPKISGPCDINNGGCEQFCFPLPPGNKRKCGCNLGLKLRSDGTSCKSTIMKENFFLVVDSDMQWIMQVSEDGRRFNKLNIPDVSIPVQVTYDPHTMRVYWTDIGTNSVNRANIDGSHHVTLASKNVRQPTGLALDRYSRNLYWTDEGTGTLNVIRTDGTHRKVLVSANMTRPRGLVLDSYTGYIWWSDWGTKTIEQAYMDGSHRKVIVRDDLEWVNGLAVDFRDSKLYWCDAKRDVIESVNLDGSGREIVKSFNDSNPHIFGITTTKDFIYWSDWNRPVLLRMRKLDQSKRTEEFGPMIFDKASDVHDYIGEETFTKDNRTNPCQHSNGNCTGLCIPVPKQHDTTNEVGDDVTGDVYLATRVCVCGTDYNGTCDRPSDGIDGIAPSFGSTCPENLLFIAPSCESKVLVNYTLPVASDNSGRVKLESPTTKPPLTLPEGKYEHRYTAVDEAGNHDTCMVMIEVKVISCPNAHEYLAEQPVEILSATCGSLYGSRVEVNCTKGKSPGAGVQFTFCGQDGKWKGDPVCKIDDLVTSTTTGEAPTVAPTALTTGTGSESTTEQSTTSTQQTQSTSQMPNNKNDSIPTNIKAAKKKSTSSGAFPTFMVVPILIAVTVAAVAALLYRYYRLHTMPLMEAMEKTLTYRNNDTEDTFRIEVNDIKDDQEVDSNDTPKVPGKKIKKRSPIDQAPRDLNVVIPSRKYGTIS